MIALFWFLFDWVNLSLIVPYCGKRASSRFRKCLVFRLVERSNGVYSLFLLYCPIEISPSTGRLVDPAPPLISPSLAKWSYNSANQDSRSAAPKKRKPAVSSRPTSIAQLRKKVGCSLSPIVLRISLPLFLVLKAKLIRVRQLLYRQKAGGHYQDEGKP